MIGTGVNERWIENWAERAHEAGGTDNEENVSYHRTRNQVGEHGDGACAARLFATSSCLIGNRTPAWGSRGGPPDVSSLA